MKSRQLLLSKAKNWISQTRCWKQGELQRSPWTENHKHTFKSHKLLVAPGGRITEYWGAHPFMHLNSASPSFLGSSIYILHASAGPRVHHDFIILGLKVSQDQNSTNKVSAIPSTDKKSNILFPALKWPIRHRRIQGSNLLQTHQIHGTIWVQRPSPGNPHWAG